MAADIVFDPTTAEDKEVIVVLTCIPDFFDARPETKFENKFDEVAKDFNTAFTQYSCQFDE